MHKNTLKKPKSQLHPSTLSPTRQENTILSSYAAARLLGIISNYTRLPFARLLEILSIAVTNNIYIEIYVKSATIES